MRLGAAVMMPLGRFNLGGSLPGVRSGDVQSRLALLCAYVRRLRKIRTISSKAGPHQSGRRGGRNSSGTYIRFWGVLNFLEKKNKERKVPCAPAQW